MLRLARDGLVYYQFNDLARRKEIVHGLFTRHGGFSPQPWASLNLSRSTGDSAENVLRNTVAMLSALGVQQTETVSAWLNHGTTVAIVDASHTGTAMRDVDALVTAETGVFLSMRFADCVPVLFYDAARGVLGLAHAGWPGVVANIVTAALQTMQRAFGCRPADVWAGIGPAIRACCYEFGADLARHVVAACPPEARVVIPQTDGTLHLDLIAAVTAQLHQAGVSDIEDAGLCTACRVDEWFSHRVEKKTGRFGVVVGRR